MTLSNTAWCSCRFWGKGEPSPHLHNLHALGVNPRGDIGVSKWKTYITSLSLQSPSVIANCDSLQGQMFYSFPKLFLCSFPLWQDLMTRLKHHQQSAGLKNIFPAELYIWMLLYMIKLCIMWTVIMLNPFGQYILEHSLLILCGSVCIVWWKQSVATAMVTEIRKHKETPLAMYIQLNVLYGYHF